MSIKFSIKGGEAIANNLAKLTPEIARAVRVEINLGALAVKKAAVKSIKRRSKGRQYGKHTASVAGQAPNTDTGNLWKSISISAGAGIITKGYTALVRSKAKYSEFLEKGTKKMVKRPFMGPALKAHRNEITKNIKAAALGKLKR